MCSWERGKSALSFCFSRSTLFLALAPRLQWVYIKFVYTYTAVNFVEDTACGFVFICSQSPRRRWFWERLRAVHHRLVWLQGNHRSGTIFEPSLGKFWCTFMYFAAFRQRVFMRSWGREIIDSLFLYLSVDSFSRSRPAITVSILHCIYTLLHTSAEDTACAFLFCFRSRSQACTRGEKHTIRHCAFCHVYPASRSNCSTGIHLQHWLSWGILFALRPVNSRQRILFSF